MNDVIADRPYLVNQRASFKAEEQEIGYTQLGATGLKLIFITVSLQKKLEIERNVQFPRNSISRRIIRWIFSPYQKTENWALSAQRITIAAKQPSDHFPDKVNGFVGSRRNTSKLSLTFIKIEMCQYLNFAIDCKITYFAYKVNINQ